LLRGGHRVQIAVPRGVVLLVWLAGAAAGGSGVAEASGFASAEFGGEHGNVVTTNPTALYFNPAGIAFSEGTNFYIGGVVALRRGTWAHTQGASELPDPPGAEGADTAAARFSNVFGAPALGATTRIGRLALGGAFYVPFGGRLSWDKNQRFVNDPNFPLAADGVQRWGSTKGALTYLTFTLGSAVRLGRLALGLTGNVMRSTVQNTMAKSFNPSAAVDPLNEGRAEIDVSGTQLSFGVGAMFEAVTDRLWLAASYQAQPGLGPMKLDGTLTLTLEDAVRRDPITYTQGLPDIIRAGARLRAARAVEVRLFGNLSRWSRRQTDCVSTRGQPCAVFPSGADATPNGTTIQNLRRRWKDSYGVTAGVSTWVRPTVELFAGVGYETAATPDSTLDTALIDSSNVRLALGSRFAVANGFYLSAGVTDVQYASRDTSGRNTLADAELPTRRADGGGKYTLWLGLFQLSLEKQL
jgi:long-chain fatty acid transport protein